MNAWPSHIARKILGTWTYTRLQRHVLAPPPRGGKRGTGLWRPKAFASCKLPMCSSILFASTGKVQTSISLHFLLRLISEHMFRICTEKYVLVLGVCCAQPYSSAGSTFAAYRSLLNYYWTRGFYPRGKKKEKEQYFRFHKKAFDEILCKLNSIENLHSFDDTPPHD